MFERSTVAARMLALALAAACAPAPPGAAPRTVRLVDEFQPEARAGDAAAATAAAPLPRTEWRFDGPPAPAAPAAVAATRGWRAGPDVAGLVVRGGRLAGRATGDFPILHLERTAGLDNSDQLHAIEVRARVSAGASLAAQTMAAETIDLKSVQALGRRPSWPASSPLQSGGEVQTYILTPGVPVIGSRIRHVLLRPTDAPGASFEIESVRLVFRREHLAAIPSGVGWQGLRDVFRESLVARAPETVSFRARVPSRGWLDLAVGTIEEGAVTFRVRVERDGRAGPGPGMVRDHTVTTPYRWEPLAIDLGGMAGETVALALELEAEAEGAIGFWGAPALRSRLSPGPGRPRGVILVQMDTLRRDHLDAYGHQRPTAPHLERLAAEGVLFRNAFAQAPWTKVSTPSILTSLYPSTHGVREFSDRLPASATTVAEAFRDAGYATLSLSSVSFTGQYTNLHQGFEELHEAGSLANRGGPLSAKTAREQVDRLLDWIERRDGGPFFAFLHVFDPHFPYEPYAPYDTLWVSPDTRTEHVRQRDEASQRITDEFMKVRQLPSRDEVAASGFDPGAYVAVEAAWYDASIRAMDAEIGRLVERLRAAGLGEEVLLVLTSDHGTEFYEHGGMWHGHSLYGELTDVPLIVHWPRRVAAGRTIDEVVQTIDVMPTLLELAGLPRPAALQGQSLALFLDPAARPAAGGGWAGWRRRPAFAERYPYAPDLPPPRDRTSDALIDGEWKLIQHRTAGAPPYELYDWRRDPLNQTDLAGRHPEVVARLGETLAAWRRSVEAARLPADAQAAAALAPEEIERLKSLGYLR